MAGPVRRLNAAVYRGDAAPTTPRQTGQPVGLWRKERPAKLVREAGQNRVGAQRGLGGDGVAAQAAGARAWKQDVAEGPVIGVAIFDTRQPVRPQHGLGPYSGRPTDAG